VHRDIRKLDGRQYYNKIDLLCGGFPCQPFSVAGQQKGKEDDRHLWPEMLRIIKESRPTWVIGENVAGFIRMALDDVLLDLETEGYTTQSFVIPACAVGGIHRRDRVWVIGYSEHNGRNGSKDRQGDTTGNVRDSARAQQIIELEGSSCSGGNDANAKIAGLQRRSLSSKNEGIRSKPYDERAGRCGKVFSGSSGFKPIRIPTEPPFRHRDDGLSKNVARLKALGNAVVPQIPELIGRAILEVLR